MRRRHEQHRHPDLAADRKLYRRASGRRDGDVQIRYKQHTGSPVTPKLSTCYASAQDNFAACTPDLVSTSLASCASGAWCTEAYTLNVSASASQGYQVTFDCNAALSSTQHCWMTGADIRVTAGVPTGVNAAPPSPEMRPIGPEISFCQRYLFRWAATVANETFGSGFVDTSTNTLFVIAFPVSMRTAPTMSFSASSTFAIRQANVGAINATTGPTVNAVGINNATANLGSSGLTAGSAALLRDSGSANSYIQASAEL
jgi:hypothetical protein